MDYETKYYQAKDTIEKLAKKLDTCKEEKRPIIDLDKFLQGLKDREYLGWLILIGSLAFTGLVFLLYQFYWWLTSIDFTKLH